MTSYAVVSTTNCSISTDTLGRLMYNCSGHQFEGFPADIPKNIEVLILRRTMTSPQVPSFQSIGLKKLQVLDLAWNFITDFAGDTFNSMTSLAILDIRGNSVFSSIPNGLFKNLFNLRSLLIDGEYLSYEISKRRFIEETQSINSLESFVFDKGETQVGTMIASQFSNLTSLAITHCINNELTVAQLLYKLQNLTRLGSINIIDCGLSALGTDYSSFDWMANVRNINLACNKLNFFDIVKFLGSQAALSQVDTLILDSNEILSSNENSNAHILGSSLFCNLSFSTSLRRLSFQKNGFFIYDLKFTRCLPNLRSISMGHNQLVSFLDDGLPLNYENVNAQSIISSLTSLYFIKASYMMVRTQTDETYCHSEDVALDQYFIDETQFKLNTATCKQDHTDQHEDYYFTLPPCLRAIQVDHLALNSEINYLYPMSIRFSPKNSLELLDLAYSTFLANGIHLDAISLTGLRTLRVINFKNMNIKRIYMITLNHADNLQEIDLSGNSFEQMTGKQLLKMFSKPLNIHKLNISSCNIGELDLNFLHQFPQLAKLDLTFNKLSQLTLNLSWLTPNGSFVLDVSFNQISTIGNIFIESFQQLEVSCRHVKVKLSNNHLRCDCDTINFLKWFQGTHDSIEGKETVTCSFRGTKTMYIVSVDVSDLEFQCTKYERILNIYIGSVLSLLMVCLFTGVLLFKYRWHIRWYWYRAKRRLLQCITNGDHVSHELLHDYVCYVNYLGITDEWIMKELVGRLESWEIGEVFVYERDAVGGQFIGSVVMQAISNSRKMLYVIGNDPEFGEVQTFHISLEISSIDRFGDMIIVYKDLITFENLQSRIPLLKALCRPDRRYPIRTIQYEANDLFWPELRYYLTGIGNDTASL